MKAYMVEVNLKAVDENGMPIFGSVIHLRSWDGHGFKKVVTDKNGKGQAILMPCNSFLLEYTDIFGNHVKQRIHVQYDIRRIGTTPDHKKIDITIVAGAVLGGERIWFGMTNAPPL